MISVCLKANIFQRYLKKMNNNEIAHLFFKILQIKGRISFFNAIRIVKNILEQSNNTKCNAIYNIIYPLSIAGLIEYSKGYWHIAPSLIIYDKTSFRFIDSHSIYNKPVIFYDDIKKINKYENNIPCIKKQEYKKLLNCFPVMTNPNLFTMGCIKNIQEVYYIKQNRKISAYNIKNNYEIVRQGEEVYTDRYIWYKDELYKIFPIESNPDSIIWARMFRDISKIFINNNTIIFKRHNILPIILGRLIFAVSNNDYDSLFETEYSFYIPDNEVINNIKRIIGIEYGYN